MVKKLISVMLALCILGGVLVSSFFFPPDNQKNDVNSENTYEELQVAFAVSDRSHVNSMKELEEKADIIVKVAPIEEGGQTVNSIKDLASGSMLPMYGYTEWNVEIAEVYKGDVKEGDQITVIQDYYRWTYENGYKQFVTISSAKPFQPKNEYLLFLHYQESFSAYFAVCDNEGIYIVPDRKMKKKIRNQEVSLVDFPIWADLYKDYPIYIATIKSIYYEIADKYWM